MITRRTGELGVSHVARGVNKESPNLRVVSKIFDFVDLVTALAESDDGTIGVAGNNEANFCRDAHVCFLLLC